MQGSQMRSFSNLGAHADCFVRMMASPFVITGSINMADPVEFTIKVPAATVLNRGCMRIDLSGIAVR